MALGPMASIQHLDLTRNNIGELPTGTFRQLSGLKTLKLAVNSMRQVKLFHITVLHNCSTKFKECLKSLGVHFKYH